MADLARQVRFHADGWPYTENPFGTTLYAEDYGIDSQLPQDELSEALTEAHNLEILCVDETHTYSVVHGTGGPHVEVELTTRQGEVISARVVGYWGGDTTEEYIDPDTAQAYADAIGLDII